jgi:hypothetical protein
VELLAAMTTFFRNVGIGPEIVGIKINSRKVLESLLFQLGIKKTAGKQTKPACLPACMGAGWLAGWLAGKPGWQTWLAGVFG